MPKNELQHPSNGAAATLFAVFIPALTPKRVLKLPAAVVALGMTDAPASTPPNVLLFATAPTPLAVTLPPVTLNTREFLMLYCVAALKVLAAPLPLMLKFAVWGVAEFWFCMKLLARPGKSEATSGALVQLTPLLRKTFPDAPGALRPVPPLFIGKTPVMVLAVSAVVA